MDAKRAKEIANRMFAKWVSDPADDGGYVLQLNKEQTEELFSEIARELWMAANN